MTPSCLDLALCALNLAVGGAAAANEHLSRVPVPPPGTHEAPASAEEDKDLPLAETSKAAVSSGDERSPWVGFPTLDYNSDRGVGVGAVINYYRFDPELEPYKSSLFLKIYVSTRLIQDHEIRYDLLRLWSLPVRVMARAGFLATQTENYCGVGNRVTCDPSKAQEAAALQENEDPDVARSYYWIRYLRPYGELFLRYQLSSMPHRVEMVGGWRSAYAIPGDFSRRIPYPGSLYAQTHPRGERGLASQLLAGLTLDNRDREAAPRRGYYAEGVFRAASRLWGSRWGFAGVYAAGSVFLPLVEDGTWVLATRLVGDVTWGNVPIIELGRSGGIIESMRFGGQAMGRGIRERRYVGKLNFVEQTELRANFVDFTVLGQRVEVGTALYADLAWVGYEVRDLRGDPWRLLWGVGLGLRILWNDTFALRFDTGVSPQENYAPMLYVKVRNPF